MVFFDPIGLALCDRTMQIIRCVNEKAPSKLKFFLSKADDIESEVDRMRIAMQITQDLCPCVGNRKIDLIPIYIPHEGTPEFLSISRNIRPTAPNRMNTLLEEMDSAIRRNVSSTLDNMEKHCQQLKSKIDERMKESEENKAESWQLFVRRSYIRLAQVLLWITLFVLIASSSESITNQIDQ